MTAILEVVMQDPAPCPRSRRPVPKMFANYLLHDYTRGPRTVAATRMRAHLQLHSMRRDEAGRFNDLEGGKPAWTKPFERDLERVVRDMRAGEWGLAYEPPKNLAALIDPAALATAIAEVKVEYPELHTVLTYFQKHPELRPISPDELGSNLPRPWGPVRRQGVYRLRDAAIRAVWEALPWEERVKVDPEA